MMKHCARCGKSYPATDEFFSTVVARGKPRLHSYCRECVREYARSNHAKRRLEVSERRRKDYSENPEKFKKWVRDHYVRNRESICKYNREYRSARKTQIAEYNDRYYLSNRTRLLSQCAEYRNVNRDRINAASKMYYVRNKDRLNKWNTEYKKKRRMSDITFRITLIFRNAVRRAIKSVITDKNGTSVIEYLDYTSNDFRKRMESLFQPGMTWDNYGEWHVDHIVPVSSFRYMDPTDPSAKQCWALSNLQPLWAEDNLRKGAKLPHELGLLHGGTNS